ncbi:aspartate 1-decarboxylase [Methylobacterium sp. E-041]|uniref:aspartate 1-decarboxylase n=1 Tax=unclassified Methylobacterium TaxID=2615210 RepID=UPI0011C8C7AF|nr:MULTISPECIES: aspartate 1-decarboxylase [unclassified Methylobacterium]RZK90280.1 MAG: aspartate 1-decarboxylase [Methylobacterium sp.]MCJ2008131.1 aspartate 1-decarboxylase [Methylobacterium sp. J-092]MCJ2041851.1 aspartate 1-decarboxylase [Methylobacterium sp. J-059]MCJ2108442.1 aspartate 1-decarboxylase [Methylobacterium sp. E-041]MCJ2112522.1 aspartate 1-decarboxylase [Methylobacterium sp. E-025]
MQSFVRAKLHGIRVTGADLNYHGSITLDADLCREAGLDPLEFVEIWNKMSGARISTYVLYGPAGSRCCVLNGAAARTCQVGDEVIIASASYGGVDDVIAHKPRVLIFGDGNAVVDRVVYDVFRDDEGRLDMRILEAETGAEEPPRVATHIRVA